MTTPFPGDARYVLTTSYARSGGMLTVYGAVTKLSGDGHWVGSGQPVTFSVGGSTFPTTWVYDFGSTSYVLIGFAQIPDPGSSVAYGVTATMAHAGTAYDGGVTATAPPAPTPLGLDQITATSMRYRFSSAGDGGSPITVWQVQYATDPGFAAGLVTITSTGTSTVTGLPSGTGFWFRARGVNAVGPGPWSTASTARTLGGGSYWDGSAWRRYAARRWTGATWAPVAERPWDGSTWRYLK